MITLQRSSYEVAEAAITDRLGKVMMRVRLTQAVQQIDISSLPKGIYLMRAGDEVVRKMK